MASKKFTTDEVYLQLYKNVSTKLDYEKSWLNSGNCNDTYSQQQTVDLLEATLETLKRYTNICNVSK